jgi:hypothetical protein
MGEGVGIAYYPDGSWVEKYIWRSTSDHGYNFIIDGEWEVKDGLIIKIPSGLAQARHPDTDIREERLLVIRINDGSLVLRPSGGTNQFIYKKL